MYDVIVYGATGFAGKLVAEYLLKTHPDARFAVAGRNRAKLDAPVAELASAFEREVPVVVADSGDVESLRAMARQTRVVATTVGPYARYGEALVGACVAERTHYCDLTGEPQFVRRMIDAHHEAAAEAGVHIVHCAGFDSIPSDLGVLLAQETVIEADGEPCDAVEYVLRGASGGFSGGTIASMAHLLDEASDPVVRRVLADPYALAPEKGPDGRAQTKPRYSEMAGVWTGPFVMAPTNERVVRRSNALLGYRYGRGFRYGESMKTGGGIGGWLKAWGMTLGLGGFAAAMATRRGRRLLMRRLPAPGEGPSHEAMENGFFSVRLYGERRGRTRVEVDVVGKRDPGYGATACMLAETALGLAADEMTGAPGISTPAASLGLPLIERLSEQLVTFEARLT